MLTATNGIVSADILRFLLDGSIAIISGAQNAKEAMGFKLVKGGSDVYSY